MIPKVCFTLCLTIAVFIQTACSQTSKAYLESDGLPDRAVIDGLQDHNGLIWFATKGGLSRFDGYRFENFNIKSKPALSANSLNAIAASAQGIWIGNEIGVDRLQFSDYTIKTFELPTYYLGCTALAARENLTYILTGSGHLLKIENDSLQNFYSNQTEIIFKSPNRILLLNNVLIIGTETNGVYLLNPDGGTIRQIAFPDDLIHDKLFLRDSTIYACSGKILQKADLTDTVFTPSPIDEPEVHNFLIDYKGDEWYVTRERKELKKKQGGEIKTLPFSTGRYNVHIAEFFEDRAKNLWLCTNDGVYVLSNQEKLFSRFGTADDPAYKNFIPSYRGLFGSQDDQLIICSYGGLYVNRSDSIIKVTEPNNTYCPYSINQKDNLLWIATEGAGMMSLDPKSLDYKFYKGDSLNTHGDGNYLMVSEFLNDSVLLLGDYNGLFTFNINTKSYNPAKIQGLDLNEKIVARSIIKGSNDQFWLGTLSGVLVLTPELKFVKRYTTETNVALVQNEVNALEQDEHGNFWIGYKSNGISYLNVKENHIKHFSYEDGLSDDRVAAIQFEDENVLWISTNDGLSRLNVQQVRFENFFVEDGLSDNEFNHGSFCRLKNGDLLFGGVNGFIRIKKGLEKSETKNQKVFLSSVEFADNSGEVIKYLGEPTLINLPYSNRFMSVSFGFSDYGVSRENYFSYKVEGLDDGWRQLGAENTIRFAALPHGNYKLRVRGAPYNGAWAENELVLPIHVQQVFYKTWWFISLMILFIGTIAYIMVQQRIRKIKEIAQMRVSISSDLHDEVGSVLTKVAMEAEILEEDVDESLKASMLNIARSCRHAMSTMRDAVWSIDSRNVSVGNLFDKFNDHCNLLFENSRFGYSINKQGQLEDLNLSLQEKKELLMIFKEATNNIVKHSNGNEVHVHVHGSASGFSISIFDNGVTAKDNSSISAGSGLVNMKLRADRIGAILKVVQKDGFKIEISMN